MELDKKLLKELSEYEVLFYVGIKRDKELHMFLGYEDMGENSKNIAVQEVVGCMAEVYAHGCKNNPSTEILYIFHEVINSMIKKGIVNRLEDFKHLLAKSLNIEELKKQQAIYIKDEEYEKANEIKKMLNNIAKV